MTIDGSRFEETWVESDDGRSMCALINGNLGWLMYLREPGDAGFSSRNPDDEGPPDAMLEYFLDNGQRDEYPLAWALPIETVRQAIEYFGREDRPPDFIAWYNDSGDGTTLGRFARPRPPAPRAGVEDHREDRPCSRPGSSNEVGYSA